MGSGGRTKERQIRVWWGGRRVDLLGDGGGEVRGRGAAVDGSRYQHCADGGEWGGVGRVAEEGSCSDSPIAMTHL